MSERVHYETLASNLRRAEKEPEILINLPSEDDLVMVEHDRSKRKEIIAKARQILTDLVPRLIFPNRDILQDTDIKEAEKMGITPEKLNQIREALLSDTNTGLPEADLNTLVTNIERELEQKIPWLYQTINEQIKQITPYAVERAKMEIDNVEKLEYTDPLTESLSMKGLQRRFEIEQRRLEELGNKNEVMIMIEFDINSFKVINDDPKRGHKVGDKVLRDIARVLTDGLRSSDAVGRRSGDEFTVILNNVNKNNIEALLKKVIDLISTVSDGTDNGKISITGGAKIIEHGHSGKIEHDYDNTSREADYAAVYEKINNPGGIAIYYPELKHDLSSPENRRNWAEKMAYRQNKRDLDALFLQEVAAAESGNQRIIDLVEKQKAAIQRRIEADIERCEAQIEIDTLKEEQT